MSFKKILFQVHKILGLTTGVIIFIVAITGCCWAFKDEIEGLNDDYKKVTPQNNPILTPTKVKEVAQIIFPNNSIHGAVFKKNDDAIEVIFYDVKPEFYQSIFLNPYSGAIIKIEDHLSGFFAFILKGHIRLWLPAEIGEQLVGCSILIFIFIIISGFFLWLPKKRQNLKQRLTFEWKKTTKWKRMNFDLHSVLGFYVCSFAIIIAFTGSMMSYDWLQYAIYKSVGGVKNPTFLIPENESGIFLKSIENHPIDVLLTKLQIENPTAHSFEVHYPHSTLESIYVEIANSKGLHYDADFLFFDQNTLSQIPSKTIYETYEKTKFPEKILRMNYDIHIGAIGGIVGKIIAFLVSLIIASLPITGVLLWYGRHYKNK